MISQRKKVTTVMINDNSRISSKPYHHISNNVETVGVILHSRKEGSMEIDKDSPQVILDFDNTRAIDVLIASLEYIKNNLISKQALRKMEELSKDVESKL